MSRKKLTSHFNIHESFSDISLLMLANFIFLLVTILITSRMANEFELPQLKREVERLKQEIAMEKSENNTLIKNMGKMSSMSTESQIKSVLKSAGLDTGQGKHDFDMFIKGLKNLPGDTIHLVVDATGSMHGVTDFLIPVLRVITIRSQKRLGAITWFSDDDAKTYQGSVGQMFDMLMKGAPFSGSDETIGKAFQVAASSAPAPGAYILIGDEPSTDRIHYMKIPAPVFTLPLGQYNPDTIFTYKTLAEKTKGKMMRLIFQ